MTLRIRRILFYSLALTFFIFAALAIFYSNGWRFDLESFLINKVSPIFFENIPTEVMIKIEKINLQFEPNFLKSSLLITNLFPKIYPITISKNGYQSWHKEIPVKPSLVAEIPPIILLPEKFALGSTTAKEMADFKLQEKNLATTSALSPDGKKIAFINKNKDLIIKWLDDSNQYKNAIFNFGSIENIAWHKNSAYLFIKYPSGLYLLETNNLPPINFQVIDSENQKFRYSSDEDAVYLLKDGSLYRVDITPTP